MPITGFRTTTLAATGRSVCPNPNPNETDVGLSGGLGGGVASLQVSYQDAPDPLVATDWLTLSGADSLATNMVHPVRMNDVTALCVNLTGATAPTLTIIWS